MMNSVAILVNGLLLLLPSEVHSFTFQKQHVPTAERRLSASSSSSSSANDESCFNIVDSFNIIVLGDLHLEDDMSSHNQARQDCIDALKNLSLLPCCPSDGGVGAAEPLPKFETMIHSIEAARAGDLSIPQLEMLLARKKYGELTNCHLVSVGDLGRKDIRHEPGDAGTTKSFQDAKDFFDGFGLGRAELVTGNHDLEGLDEFDTDEANLQAWMDCFKKEDGPHFHKYIGEKTLVLGLSTVRFRDAPYSSHEVHVDDEQLEWFVKEVERHPDKEGWKIIVISHAPPMGSGLRVLQNVHVMNGCAWLNHCSNEETRSLFIQTVKNNPQIKLWFSGHFHLSHDFEDAISTVGSCTFVQCGVMGPVSTRDGRRQTRLVQGNSDTLKIYTINHHLRQDDGAAQVRLDAEINLLTDKVTIAHGSEDFDHNDWFQAFVPREEDGCYLETPDGLVADPSSLDSRVCWWHMNDGKVLGLHQGQLVEYDTETLSPLGIVVDKKTLDNREVLVIEGGSALVLLNKEGSDQNVEVVHPNDDGSYWRKVQRNKRVRQEEKAREMAALSWFEKSSSSKKK